MTPPPWRAVEPVNRIVPRIEQRRERGRREQPFPPVGDEDEEDDDTSSRTPTPRPSHTEQRPETTRRDPDDSDEHRIDVVVAPLRVRPLPNVPRRVLPGGQVLPACCGARTVH